MIFEFAIFKRQDCGNDVGRHIVDAHHLAVLELIRTNLFTRRIKNRAALRQTRKTAQTWGHLRMGVQHAPHSWRHRSHRRSNKQATSDADNENSRKCLTSRAKLVQEFAKKFAHLANNSTSTKTNEPEFRQIAR